MTVLSALQDAAIELVGRRPAAVFGATDTFELELQAHANKSARAITEAYAWRALTTLCTINGNGADTAHALPTDYDRMGKNAQVFSSRSRMPLTPARDLNQWLDFEVSGVFGAPGFWILLGGQIQIKPALALTETARFYYQSKNRVMSADPATAKDAFDADTDVFRLPEHLVSKDVIWRWRQQKRLEYAEDMQNFQIALNEEIGKDRGPGIIAIGKPRYGTDAALAFPGVITP